MIVMEWIKDRLNEPSTYAAMGVCVVALGVLYNQPALIWSGIAGAGIAFVLKEKDIF